MSETVMTVTGPVAGEDLGVTLPHEHIFIDIRNQFADFEDPEKQRISQEPVRMSNLGVLRRNPYGVKDNLLLDDLEMAVGELEYFKALGGRTVVDCTSIGINRQPTKLRELARRTGLNIVTGCGYYTYDTHPEDMDGWSPEEIAEQMQRDLTVGMDGTDVKAGVIGEIGTSNPIRQNEKKSLLAAALVFKANRLGVQVHTYPWGEAGLEAVDILVEAGVDPHKIVICHTDIELHLGYMEALLKKGVYLEFDNFGKEFYIDPADRKFAGGVFARDIERVEAIKELIARGFEKQLLITNDLCLKSMLRHYGGWGYDHILRHVVPMMLHEGISQETIANFLQHNPRSWLTG